LLGALGGLMRKLVALFIFIFFFSTIAFAGEVEVALDKAHYFKGEQVKITLTNNTEDSIYSVVQSLTPAFGIQSFEFEKTPNVWERVPLRCEWPDCSTDFDEPGEIKMGKSAVFTWEPKVFKGINDGLKYALPKPGNYRLTVSYQLRQGDDSSKWTQHTVRSGEFSLENTDLAAEEVELRVNKDKYARGEEVKFVFENNLSFLVALDGLGINLEKKDEAGKWKGIPLHCSWPECDIDHDTPQLKPGQSKEAGWGQKIYIRMRGKDEEGQGMEKFSPAEPGVYRISWTYQVRKDVDSKNWKWVQAYSDEFAIE